MVLRTHVVSSKARRKAYMKGKVVEWFACFVLLLKGYRFLAWRFRTPVGELDLVMQKKGFLVGVEVKKRSLLEDALSCVTPRAEKRLKAALHIYQKTCGRSFEDCRLDVFAVGRYYCFCHLKNAI